MTPDAPTRRRLLAGGAAVLGTTVATQALGPAPALAATTYTVNPYTATTVPNARQRHFLNRLGCGWSRESFAQLRAAGTAPRWLEQQLAPAGVPESPVATALPSWFPGLAESPVTKWARNEAGTKGGGEKEPERPKTLHFNPFSPPFVKPRAANPT